MNITSLLVCLVFCSVKFSLNAQINNSLQEFEKTEFYEFFNLSLKGNYTKAKSLSGLSSSDILLKEYEPGSFKDSIDLIVECKGNSILAMQLLLKKEFINHKTYRFLAADIFTNFLFLNLPQLKEKSPKLIEKMGMNKQPSNALEHNVFTLFNQKDFLYCYATQNEVAILKNEKEVLSVTVLNKQQIKPASSSPHQFLTLDEIFPITQTKSMTMKKSPSMISWLNEDANAKFFAISEIAFTFDNPDQALLHLYNNYDLYSENGMLIQDSEIKTLFGPYTLMFEIPDIFGVGMKGFIIVCNKKNKNVKLYVGGNEELTAKDVILLFKKVHF